MKKLLKIFLLCLAILPAYAQDDVDLPQNSDPKVKDKIEAARIAYLTDQLSLTPAEAEKFWPVYREFSTKRIELKKQYRQAKRNPNPNVTTEENERNLVDLGLKLKQQELDLEKDYSGRLMKVISAQKVRALPEAEKNFKLMILDQIQRRQQQQQRRENLRDRSQQRLQQRNN
jgi:hypothetical protein